VGSGTVTAYKAIQLTGYSSVRMWKMEYTQVTKKLQVFVNFLRISLLFIAYSLEYVSRSIRNMYNYPVLSKCVLAILHTPLIHTEAG
jgi:hypothetical protein